MSLKTLESFLQGSKWHAVKYQYFKTKNEASGLAEVQKVSLQKQWIG